MEYLGVEYAVVRTMSPDGWRWSVKRDHGDRTGLARDRDDAVRKAKKTSTNLSEAAPKRT